MYNHSTDKKSEARKDKATVLSTGHIPTPKATMSKSTLSYTR